MSCPCKKAVNIFESASTPYRIGKTGENVYQEIEFNFSKWLSEYPDAKIDLLIRVPKNGFYLLAEGITESTYLWKPSAFDLANPGRAAVMARMSSGEVRAKSDPIPFEIVRSMDYNLDISEPGPARPSLMDEWIEDIYEAAARYPKIGEEDGYWYVWDVVEGEWKKTDTYAGGDTLDALKRKFITITKVDEDTYTSSETASEIEADIADNYEVIAVFNDGIDDIWFRYHGTLYGAAMFVASGQTIVIFAVDSDGNAYEFKFSILSEQDVLDLVPVKSVNGRTGNVVLNSSDVGAVPIDAVPYVTPEDYDALGDGVHDDTVALQSAVRAGNIICKSGKTYLISKPILFSNHIYDFGGCTIKLADNYEKNSVDIDGVSYGYCGLVFDNLDNFCVRNLTLDCNKAGNASTAITGAIFSDSIGMLENCTFENATYKHLVINRGNNLHFYDTTLKNLGTAANSSDIYVSGTPESSAIFDGLIAVRESGNTSTGQVAYINNGNFRATNVYTENCHMLTDSRSGNTVVQNAVVRNAKKLEWIDQESSRANPANITYENVYYYNLERTSGGYALQAGGVSSLTINNMFVQIASGSTFSHAFYFQSNSGKLNHNVRINGLRMDLGSVALQNGIYFAGDDTTENVLFTDCHFKLSSMTRAYIGRIANNPKNVRFENCTFDNFQFQWVYGNTNQHLLGVSNATPKRAATADLPTLTTADTGSIIYDTTLGIFKFWNGSAWIDPRPSVPAMATDPDMTDWDTGKIVDAAVLKSGFTLVGGVLSRKANVSDIPTAVSELTNDSGYQTAQDVQTAIAGVRQLPTVTASDNGKFLRVVNGAWAAETVSTWQGGSY